MITRQLTARHDGVELDGTLRAPDRARAMVVMHPGSGPSDRDNDVFFPPIRRALLAAGVAVASYDKRGVGGSSGSWLAAGIEDQAGDLLAGMAAASRLLPGVPTGVFGHSQGGWVAVEATRRGSPAFVVTSAGPAVTVGDQERFSARTTPPAASAATEHLLTMAERGADHAELLDWLATHGARAWASHLLGPEPPTKEQWGLLVRLAGYDPAPALRALTAPLLAVFGAEDDVTPVQQSLAALDRLVRPGLLTTCVLPGGGHRMSPSGSSRFVAGYPDVVVNFIVAQTG